MPKEPFLINPPGRKASKRKTSAGPSRRKGLPKSFKGKSPHRITVYKTGKNSYSRSPFSPSRAKGITVNPYGEEVIVVGTNPRRKRRKKAVSRRRKSYRRNPVSRKRRVTKRRVTRRRTRRNPVARRRTYSRKRTYRRNPVARRRRTYRRRVRRNPAMAIGTMNLKKPMTFVLPVLTGVASAILTKKIPSMLNLTGNMRYAGQVAVGIVGGMLLKKPLGAQNAMVFAVVSLASTAQEVLADKFGGVFAGLDYSMSEFVDYNSSMPMLDSSMGGYGDYTNEFGEFVDMENGDVY